MEDNKVVIVHAAESVHFYDAKDGSPAYEKIGKNGKLRATTLRDARTDNLVPSTTTILKEASRPGLERWIREQVLLAALTLPRIDNEPEDKWIERVILDSREQGKKAAETGTAIHMACEQAYEGKLYASEYVIHVTATIQAIKEKYGDQEWVAEKSFAHPLMYGGKVDLYSPAGYCIDFKTKSFDESQAKKGLSYDEHICQLAAYRVGIGLEGAICANVFISTSNPGLVAIEEYTQEDLMRGWGMFLDLLSYWKKKNRFGG